MVVDIIQHANHKIITNLSTYAYVKLNIKQYIILNNGILKSNSSLFPQSEGYITQYTPSGVYWLIVNENNEVNNSQMIVKMI